MIRILIVDDHEIVREGIRAILETGADVEVVGDTGSADNLSALVADRHPDVVLLDVRLRGVSGPEACRQLRATDPDVAVIMISTFDDDEVVDECIRAGARGYVVEDIDRFELKKSIRTVRGGGGIVPPAVNHQAARPAPSACCPPPRSPGPRSPRANWPILRLVREGLSNREVGASVHLSENTVKSHLQEIFRKLEVRNRVEAALRSAREGWI